ncbi:MAG: LPP20 family lipoprotein [Bacteroidetes bacterium]|nr:LPP20 family lipoprotein [Bacteroidota bacterium]MBS1541285.1 LPP20 family lipoprotein [Bacteroidota bacterium]
MKKIGVYSIVAVAFAAALIGGCKSKQKMPDGEKEIVVPCSGPDFFTTNKVFRANSIGESMDQVTSKKKALTNARNELAQAIQTTVKTVTDNYTNSTSMDKKEQLEQKFESLNREVVDQTLQGVRTICEKLVQTKDGNYKTYVAIELSADDLVKEYNNRLSQDDKLKVDYDYEKFKDTFNKEMDKMSSQRRGGN